MPNPFRARSPRARLTVEHLEDRTNPSGILATDPTSFAADRVLVTVNATADAHVIADSGLARSATRLGGNAYSVTLNTGVSVGQAISVFSGTAGVRFAEADYSIGVTATPNDPGYSQTWGLNNTGQTVNGSTGTADADIDAPEAWNTAKGTGAHVVAIIDTGVRYDHPDLAANMWKNAGEIAGDGIDNDGNGLADDVYGANYSGATATGNPLDDNGHGTHVAGTIGGVGNNGVGVAGVAWTTKIMALKFLTASGSGSTSGAVSAIYYAVNNGATILSNSWGGGGYSQSLYDAISYANAKGVIFVAAAGNAASNNDATANYPSNYALPNVVAVASTTSTDGLSSFSNYGANTVTLGAPGSNIYSTYWSSSTGNTYAYLSGTSMATPHVSGALAVYWDANGTATAAQVIQRLKTTVDPITALSGKTSTGGRLNLNKMLNGSVPPSPPPPPADTNGARVTAGAFSGTTADTFSKIRLTFNEAIQASSFTAADVVALTGPGGAISVTGVAAVSGSNNTQFDVTFAAQSAIGTYTITVGPDILDVAGNQMNQNQTGANGENPGDRYTTSAALAPPRQTFSYSGAALAISDLTTTTVNVFVPSTSVIAGLAITDLNLTVTLKHTYLSDLQITLVSPTGKSVLLFNRRGGANDNLTGTTFDDEATVAISAGAAPFSGTYRPEALLSGFDGLLAGGTWKLQIYDAARLDTGSVSAVSLSIATGPGGQSVQTFAFLDGDATPTLEPKLLPSKAAVFLDPRALLSSNVTVTAPASQPTATAAPLTPTVATPAIAPTTPAPTATSPTVSAPAADAPFVLLPDPDAPFRFGV